MNKQEARIQMGLLKLNIKRVTKEIERLLEVFCGRGDHYFKKIWKPVGSDTQLLKVEEYICDLCSVRKPLETGGHRCPVCNEVLEIYANIGIEDITSCSKCGFTSGSGRVAGLSCDKIPSGDVIEFK